MSGLSIGLVGCGATKLTHAAPAGDLYTGNLFRAASGYAAGAYDTWLILSARYGLIHPTIVVAPYDQRITDLSAGERASWAGEVTELLAGIVAAHGAADVTIGLHAGADYRRPLLARWTEAGADLPWGWEVPLEGFGIGQQLGWYAARRRELVTA